ncbi:MAG: aspartate aminotransferase family protein [Alistipes sp.]|nr:aspartate aminotransferase family protein [Alistipes sp.]MBP3601681.1 aspartate aminotransferase family protein [Alistipes sp.]
MNLFQVYSLLDMEPVKAQGAYLWDKQGVEYLDFYGGHAVISIGHTHPHYVEKITDQLSKIGFYSNAVINNLQVELAEKLGPLTGYPDYELFLCNSGAEANENAVKLASFTTGRERVLAMHGAFHGRTSMAVALSDNPNIQAPVNKTANVTFINLNDVEALKAELATGEYAAVIIEPIQGVGGIRVASDEFLKAAREQCDKTGTLLIMDEVQSGFGRSGKFFAHQWSGVQADIVSMAKGIANGFPVGAIIISPKIPAKSGMLGTTFGGSHLACAAAIAVADVIKAENLVENARVMGEKIVEAIKGTSGITDIRGRGLMIGIDLTVPQADFRKVLREKHHIMTGLTGKYTLRLLPPLVIGDREVERFAEAFRATALELGM